MCHRLGIKHHFITLGYPLDGLQSASLVHFQCDFGSSVWDLMPIESERALLPALFCLSLLEVTLPIRHFLLTLPPVRQRLHICAKHFCLLARLCS